jgi:cell division protein FtsB
VFTENVLSFAGAYGLAIQGLGAAAVSTNLLPHDVASHRVWAAKRPWFVAAAAMILVGLLLKGFNSYAVQSQLNADRAESRLSSINATYSQLDRLRGQYARLEGEIDGGKDQIRDSLEMFAYRNFWPQLQKLLGESVSAPLRDQGLFQQIATSGQWQAVEEKYRQLKSIPRQQRELAVIESMGAQYVPDVSRVGRAQLQKLVDEKIGLQASRSESSSSRTSEEAERSSGEATRGFIVWVVGRTPLPQSQVLGKLRVPVYNRSRTLAEQPRYASLGVAGYESASREGYTPSGGERRDTPSRRGPVYRGALPDIPPEEMDPFEGTPGGRLPDAEETGPAIPDPMFPGESMAEDTTFGMVWLVTIRDDGVNIPGEESSENTNGRR